MGKLKEKKLSIWKIFGLKISLRWYQTQENSSKNDEKL